MQIFTALHRLNEKSKPARRRSTRSAAPGSARGRSRSRGGSHSLLRSSSAIRRGKVNLSKGVWEKSMQRGETHSAESDKMINIPAKVLNGKQAALRLISLWSA